MVTITPKKADFMETLRRHRLAPLLLVTLTMCLVLGGVTLFGLPNHNDLHANEKLESSRGGGRARLAEMREHTGGASSTVNAAAAAAAVDPVAAKIRHIDEMRAKSQAKLDKLATGDKDNREHGGGAEPEVRQETHELTHHDNPGINPLHGKVSPLDVPHHHDSIALDNSHEFSHDEKEPAGAGAGAGAVEDPMYHSKHKHSPDEHPHAGTHLRGTAPAGDAAEQTEEQPVHELLHYHRPSSDSGSGSTDSGSNTSSAAAEDKEAADAAALHAQSASTEDIVRSVSVPPAEAGAAFQQLRSAYALTVTSLDRNRVSTANAATITARAAAAAAAAAADTAGGGGGVEEERSQPLDGVELFHKAVRTGEICSDRAIPYKLSGASAPAGTGNAAGAAGSYSPSKQEKDMFHFILDLVEDAAPTAFIELSPTQYPMQQALAPLVANALPHLAVVLVPVGQSSGGRSSSSSSRKKKAGDDDADDGADALVSNGAGRDSRSGSSSGSAAFADLTESAVTPPIYTDTPDASDTSGGSDRGNGAICVPQTAASNLYVLHRMASLTSTAAATLETPHGPLGGSYDCAQLVEGLLMLVGKQLPFEFEETFGRLLCRCKLSVLPAKLPKDNYFSYWPSMTALVQASVASLQICSITVEKYATGYAASSNVYSKKSDSASAKPALHMPLGFGYMVISRTAMSSSATEEKSADNGKYLPVSHLLPAGGTALVGTSLHHLTSSLFEYYETASFNEDTSATSTSTTTTSSSSGTTDMRNLVIFGSYVRSSTDAEAGAGTTPAVEASLEAKWRRKSLAAVNKAAREGTKARKISEIWPEGQRGGGAGKSSGRPSSRIHSTMSPRRRLLLDAHSYLRAIANNTSGSTTSSTTTTSSGAETDADERMPRVSSAARYDTVLSSTWELPARLAHLLGMHTAGLPNTEVGGEMPPSLGRFDALQVAETEAPVAAGVEKDIAPPLSSRSILNMKDAASASGGGNSGNGDADGSWHGTASFSAGATGTGGRSFYQSAAAQLPSDLSPVDSDTRTRQHLLQQREELVYRKWMSALRVPWFDSAAEESSTNINSPAEVLERRLPRRMSHLLAHSRLVYVFGRHVSTLSTKIAASMKRTNSGGGPAAPGGGAGRGLLVSVLTDAHAVAPHLALQRLLGIRNNIVCHSKMSREQMGALLLAPERADVSVMQLDVFARMLVLATLPSTAANTGPTGDRPTSKNDENTCSAIHATLEEQVAVLLHMAAVTFVELPSIARLHQMLRLVVFDECAATLISRYPDGGTLLVNAVNRFDTTGGAAAVVRKLNWYADESHSSQTSLYRVVIAHGTGAAAAAAEHPAPANLMSNRYSERGVSLYTLSHLGMDRALRRQLLELYVELPLWSAAHDDDDGAKVLSDVAPWTVFATLADTHAFQGTSRHDEHALLRLHYYSSAEVAHATHDKHSSDTPLLAEGIGIASRKIDAAAAAKPVLGSTLSDAPDLATDRQRARLLYRVLSQELSAHAYELAGGKFSFVEHGSGYGYLSAYLAARYRNATVISLERNELRTNHHVRMVEELKLHNNAVCHKTQEDDSILLNIVECPELFRFQLLTHGLADAFSVSNLHDWGKNVGTVLSSALTTFLYVPPAEQVSLAMEALFPWQSVSGKSEGRLHLDTDVQQGRLWGPHRPADHLLPKLAVGDISSAVDTRLRRRADVRNHPLRDGGKAGLPSIFEDFESAWLLGHSRAHAGTIKLTMTPMYLDVPATGLGQKEEGGNSGPHASTHGRSLLQRERSRYRRNESRSRRRRLVGTAQGGEGVLSRIRVPFVRCDVVNMTRNVHHHYDYKKDGHARTYTMQVLVNSSLTESTKAAILSRYVHVDSGINAHYNANHIHEHHHHHHDGDRPEVASHSGVDAFSYMTVQQEPDHIQLLPPDHYQPAAPLTRTHTTARAAAAAKPLAPRTRVVLKRGKTEMVGGKLVTQYFNVTVVDHTATAAAAAAEGINATAAAAEEKEEEAPRASEDYSAGIALPSGAHPNQNAVVQVELHRDKDSWPIPYTSIHGVTLISALRLGLHPVQRERFFSSFLKLPLYEDMAPWNIVLMGPRLDYIDYDTREVVFDADIPKAYRIMTVLMNYKRTVADFRRCGRQAPTVYGVPYVSDCVGSNERFHNAEMQKSGNGSGKRFGWGYNDSPDPAAPKLKCDDLAVPVPCDDGSCHTDYISCLRSLSKKADELSSLLMEAKDAKDQGQGQGQGVGPGGGQHQSWHASLAAAMRAGMGSFDEHGLKE